MLRPRKKPSKEDLSNETFQVLIRSIKSTYPNIDKKQIAELSNFLLKELDDYIADGYAPALMKQNPDGSMDVRVLEFKRTRRDSISIEKRLAGDTTTDAPPSDIKKKKKPKRQ